jgi:hypothetical protein
VLPPVLVEVIQPCVSATEVPAVPGTNFKPGMSLEQKIAAARADIADREAYMIRADSLLRACTSKP